MDRFKITAITFITVAASMMLLPKTETDHGQSADTTPSSRKNHSMRPLPGQSVHQEFVLDLEFNPTRNPPPGFDPEPLPQAETTQKSADNWALTLYPELARILDLEYLPADTAMAELVPMLSNPDPVVRLAALESLMDMDHLALLPTLSAALEDPEPQVRILALRALGTLDDPLAVSSIAACLFDREIDVRLAAIDALANLEYEQATHSLAGLLSDQNPEIRHRAVNTLGEIGGRQALAYLLQASEDPDADIRANANAILYELGDATRY
jgi:hypothetical protein